jgi:hypothetical protein
MIKLVRSSETSGVILAYTQRVIAEGPEVLRIDFCVFVILRPILETAQL